MIPSKSSAVCPSSPPFPLSTTQTGDPVPTRSAPEIATDGAVIMRPPPLLDDDVAYVDEDSDLIPLEDVTDVSARARAWLCVCLCVCV